MIKRQHVVKDFFDEADVMRATLDARFKDPYVDSIPWYYFCDPRMYSYLRTMPQRVFPPPVFERFMQRLRQWCMDNLGLTPMNLPYLHLMINGCKLGLHSDFHNGAWGYVYSLTRWQERKFTGGETLLLRDGVPSYKKHHVHGEVLYELIPAQFNQLLVFDDRIVHATPTVEGNMDPMDGRIAMVGHIRATSPLVRGSLSSAHARHAIMQVLPHLRDRLRMYKDVQGTITYRLEIRASGTVESGTPLTDNIVTAITGYDPSEPVAAVKALIHQTVTGIKFPAAAGPSTIIVPLLIPLPELSPIEFVVEHNSPRDALKAWAQTQLGEGEGRELQGHWEDDVFMVREPIAGTIRIEPRHLSVSFDPPMWVPSQRESFQRQLQTWANTASASAAR